MRIISSVHKIKYSRQDNMRIISSVHKIRYSRSDNMRIFSCGRPRITTYHHVSPRIAVCKTRSAPSLLLFPPPLHPAATPPPPLRPHRARIALSYCAGWHHPRIALAYYIALPSHRLRNASPSHRLCTVHRLTTPCAPIIRIALPYYSYPVRASILIFILLPYDACARTDARESRKCTIDNVRAP